jgi:hypothetical protein
MFLSRVLSSMIGLFASMPTRDQVPELMYAKSSSRVGTAATAEAVSWVATATTGTAPSPVWSATEGMSLATVVPGGTSSCISDVEMPSASKRSGSQSLERASRSCEVVAKVNSENFSPVRK